MSRGKSRTTWEMVAEQAEATAPVLKRKLLIIDYDKGTVSLMTATIEREITLDALQEYVPLPETLDAYQCMGYTIYERGDDLPLASRLRRKIVALSRQVRELQAQLSHQYDAM